MKQLEDNKIIDALTTFIVKQGKGEQLRDLYGILKGVDEHKLEKYLETAQRSPSGFDASKFPKYVQNAFKQDRLVSEFLNPRPYKGRARRPVQSKYTSTPFAVKVMAFSTVSLAAVTAVLILSGICVGASKAIDAIKTDIANTHTDTAIGQMLAQFEAAKEAGDSVNMTELRKRIKKIVENPNSKIRGDNPDQPEYKLKDGKLYKTDHSKDSLRKTSELAYGPVVKLNGRVKFAGRFEDKCKIDHSKDVDTEVKLD